MCQRYQILSDLLINSIHFGVRKSYQNTKESHQHDEHTFRSRWPDGKGTKCALQSLTFGTLFLVVKR